MLRRLQSSITSLLGQLRKSLIQLRIRDIASRWTPRLLNKTPRSSVLFRGQLVELTDEENEALSELGADVADGSMSGQEAVEHILSFRTRPVAPNTPAVGPRSGARAPVGLWKQILPRTAAGLGLWAWGTFSPGKPSTLVVGGSPALGPGRANKPHTIALLA